tara:strand:+ start:85 stop:519 length:435 start_codon:yes stop_codon:yes gene_type:complete
MKKEEFNELFLDIMMEVKKTRDEGQKEYAHTEENVFANFERVANSLDISREQALMVYLMKHIDGINAWIKGHHSQREDVTGRIKDSIVYLCLLWGMAKEQIVSEEEIDAFFDEKGFIPSKTPNGSIFNPETGEVSYQSLGEDAV